MINKMNVEDVKKFIEEATLRIGELQNKVIELESKIRNIEIADPKNKFKNFDVVINDLKKQLSNCSSEEEKQALINKIEETKEYIKIRKNYDVYLLQKQQLEKNRDSLIEELSNLKSQIKFYENVLINSAAKTLEQDDEAMDIIIKEMLDYQKKRIIDLSEECKKYESTFELYKLYAIKNSMYYFDVISNVPAIQISTYNNVQKFIMHINENNLISEIKKYCAKYEDESLVVFVDVLKSLKFDNVSDFYRFYETNWKRLDIVRNYAQILENSKFSENFTDNIVNELSVYGNIIGNVSDDYIWYPGFYYIKKADILDKVNSGYFADLFKNVDLSSLTKEDLFIIIYIFDREKSIKFDRNIANNCNSVIRNKFRLDTFEKMKYSYDKLVELINRKETLIADLLGPNRKEAALKALDYIGILRDTFLVNPKIKEELAEIEKNYQKYRDLEKSKDAILRRISDYENSGLKILFELGYSKESLQSNDLIHIQAIIKDLERLESEINFQMSTIKTKEKMKKNLEKEKTFAKNKLDVTTSSRGSYIYKKKNGKEIKSKLAKLLFKLFSKQYKENVSNYETEIRKLNSQISNFDNEINKVQNEIDNTSKILENNELLFNTFVKDTIGEERYLIIKDKKEILKTLSSSSIDKYNADRQSLIEALEFLNKLEAEYFTRLNDLINNNNLPEWYVDSIKVLINKKIIENPILFKNLSNNIVSYQSYVELRYPDSDLNSAILANKYDPIMNGAEAVKIMSRRYK